MCHIIDSNNNNWNFYFNQLMKGPSPSFKHKKTASIFFNKNMYFNYLLKQIEKHEIFF